MLLPPAPNHFIFSPIQCFKMFYALISSEEDCYYFCMCDAALGTWKFQIQSSLSRIPLLSHSYEIQERRFFPQASLSLSLICWKSSSGLVGEEQSVEITFFSLRRSFCWILVLSTDKISTLYPTQWKCKSLTAILLDRRGFPRQSRILKKRMTMFFLFLRNMLKGFFF